MRIVDDVVHAIGTATRHSGSRRAREIVGVDVVGVRVVMRAQSRCLILDAIQRQAMRSVNSGCAQYADHHAQALAPRAQHTLGIDPPPRPYGARAQRARLVDARAVAIAIHARSAYVDQALW